MTLALFGGILFIVSSLVAQSQVTAAFPLFASLTAVGA